MYKKDEQSKKNLTTVGFFNHPANTIEIIFDNPIKLRLDEITKMQIDAAGHSSVYPDSQFIVDYLYPDFQVTRRRINSSSILPVEPIMIDFDLPITMTQMEIRKLEIDASGFSRFYPNSYFEYKRVDQNSDSGYQLIRHRKGLSLDKITLADLNQKNSLLINNFPAFKELKEQKAEFPPIFCIEKFPEDNFIGAGNMGQVHLIFSEKAQFALKLDRLVHNNVKIGRTFTLRPEKETKRCELVNPLNSVSMQRSFTNNYYLWESIKHLLSSDYIAGLKGLIFVNDLNQWGLIFEYIDGYSFDKFSDDLKDLPQPIKYCKILKMSKQLVEGLKVLDEAGHAHTDLLNPNILVRNSNHTPVLIDYLGAIGIKDEKKEKEINSVESRQQFGLRLSQIVQTLNDYELTQLAEDCKSEKTFVELSWDLIFFRLNQIENAIDDKEAVKENYTINCYL